MSGSLPTRRNFRIGRLKAATWTHREGRSRETYFWLPTFTLHVSTHRKASRS